MAVLQEQKPVMAAQRSVGLFSSDICFAFWRLPLPRLAGVTNALCLLKCGNERPEHPARIFNRLFGIIP